MAQRITWQDLAPLVGLAYDPETMDCGHLVRLTQQTLFGRDVDLPMAHPRGRRGQAAVIGRLSATMFDQVLHPETGDVAVYTQPCADGGEQFHVGTALRMGCEWWLLHVQVGGSSRIQRESEVQQFGLHRQGFYRWRAAAAQEASSNE